jgi:hypothetical protein
MRGAERPAKVAWTHPFLRPLKPLDQDAARRTFLDIADDKHELEEVDKILTLTDNMPLAINLIANLADSEGCSNVLWRWDVEKTSMISDGYDRRSNLDLSISLSLSSPRITSIPHAQDLLGLLSMLPDGLSDADLVQSNLPIENIHECKTALIRTALAYNDEHKRLRALVPIREYMQKIHPPGNHLVQALLTHFWDLLMFYHEYRGTHTNSGTVARISSNYSNIQHVLQNRLQESHGDITDSIYCTCDLNHFSLLTGHGTIPLFAQIRNMLPYPRNHRLEAYCITELFNSARYYPISDPETLVSQALEHVELFDDTDLICMLRYLVVICWHLYDSFR